MKTFVSALLLGLAACGGASSNDTAAEANASETTDAVTDEAVRDTQAAMNDAAAAADAELDRLGNSIDEDAAASDKGGRTGNAAE